MKKPRISMSAATLLAELDKEIRAHDRRGSSLIEAPSDLWDSWRTRQELDELIRRRFVRVVRLTGDRDYPKWWDEMSICGSTWTVDLTEHAINLFWPERAAV